MWSGRTTNPHAFDDHRLQRREFFSICAATLLATRRADANTAPPGYTYLPFPHGDIRLDVWTKGNARHPLVFILHDMTGLNQGCFDLGDALVSKQFSVAIPRFFGGFGGGVLGYLKACELKSRFRCFDTDDYGPIMPWVKALANHGSGNLDFGAIGNCMTGILPLLMLRSKRCVAPVLCQPAFPFNPVFSGKAYQSALGLPQIDLDFAALRTRRDQVPVLGLRYEIDSLCRPERFCALLHLLGDQFKCLELPGKGHSTLLGKHKSPAAFEAVLGFLQHRLKGAPWSPPNSPCPATLCTASGGG